MSAFIEHTLSNSEIVQLLQSLERPAYLKSNVASEGFVRDLLVGNPLRVLRLNTNNEHIAISEELLLEKDREVTTSPIGILHFTKGWVGAAPYPERLVKAEKSAHRCINDNVNPQHIKSAFLVAAYYTWSYQFDHTLGKGLFYFSDECSNEERQKVTALLRECQTTSGDKKARLKEGNSDLAGINWRTSQSKKQYQEQFEQIQGYIKAGDCYQVNLTQRFEAKHELTNTELLSFFLRHAEDSAANYCAYLCMSENHQILSFSPEQFLQIDNQRIQTKPIKGTIKNTGELSAEDTSNLRNSKNLAENLMIVDLLRNDLGKVCENGSIKVDKLFNVESYKNVHHLVSTISGTIRPEISPIQAFLSAFPGGSITGAPKIRAMEVIEELEACARRFYCGSIFYYSASGHFDSNILIRTVERIDDALLCWGGGGIVSDSEMHSEYQESLDKVSQITGIYE